MFDKEFMQYINPGPGKDGRTILHYMAMNGDAEDLFEIATAFPKILDKQDKDGNTAFHLAILSSRPEDMSKPSILHRLGANMKLANKDGLVAKMMSMEEYMKKNPEGFPFNVDVVTLGDQTQTMGNLRKGEIFLRNEEEVITTDSHAWPDHFSLQELDGGESEAMVVTDSHTWPEHFSLQELNGGEGEIGTSL
jgi:hypothetical protein